MTSLNVLSARKSPLEAGVTAEDVYNRSLALLETWPPFRDPDSGALDSLKFSLGLKETSPLIETHYQLYKQAVNASQTFESEEILYQWYGDCAEGALDGFVTAETCRYRYTPFHFTKLWYSLTPSTAKSAFFIFAYLPFRPCTRTNRW